MYGTILNIGDCVVWNERSLVQHPEHGPFTIATVKNNDDPDACACGANRSNNYDHDNQEQCHELPAQLVTLRRSDGSMVLDGLGEPDLFSSYWFRRA